MLTIAGEGEKRLIETGWLTAGVTITVTYMRSPVGLPFTTRREDPCHIRSMLAGQAISRKGQAYLLNFGDSATMHPSHLGAVGAC